MDRLSKKLLKFAADACGKRLTVEELAVKCEVSPLMVYKRLQDDAFRSDFIAVLKHSLVADVPPVLNSLVLEAKLGSFKHQKLLLELAGVYTEEQKITANLLVKTEDSPFQSPEERQKFLDELVKRVRLRE